MYVAKNIVLPFIIHVFNKIGFLFQKINQKSYNHLLKEGAGWEIARNTKKEIKLKNIYIRFSK